MHELIDAGNNKGSTLNYCRSDDKAFPVLFSLVVNKNLQIVKGFTGEPALSDTEVIRVVNELWVARANIQHDGQHTMGRNATCRTIKGKLPDRNAHP
jgi:hypothetical protein